MGRAVAIMLLRVAHFRHELRSGQGIADTISRFLMLGLGTLFSIVLAIGLGVAVHLIVRDGEAVTLRIIYYVAFYTFAFFGIGLPVFRGGGGGAGLTPSKLLLFPISRRRLYGITLAASFGSAGHLFYYPALLAVGITGILIPGTGIATGFAVLLLFLAFVVAGGHTLVLLIQVILRRRRIREIATILAFMALILASVGPLGLERLFQETAVVPEGPVRTAVAVMGFAGKALPPSLAAEGLGALNAGDVTAVSFRLLWLAVWVAVTFVAGYVVFSRYHLGERDRRGAGGKSKKGKKAISRHPRRLSMDSALLSLIPGEVRAVASKDLRYLFRSVLGKFNFLMAPVLVLIVVFVFSKTVTSPVLGLDPESTLLYGMLIYVVFLSNNFIHNSFAWAGGGAQVYFLAPVSLGRVLAGKNLALWCYNGAIYLVCLLVWSLFMGVPQATSLVTSALVFFAALIGFTTGGNIVSTMFPVRRKIGSFVAPPSQTAVLLSLLSLAANVSVIGAVLFVSGLIGTDIVQVFALLVLLGAHVALYVLVLRIAARLLAGRAEKFLQAMTAQS